MPQLHTQLSSSLKRIWLGVGKCEVEMGEKGADRVRVSEGRRDRERRRGRERYSEGD